MMSAHDSAYIENPQASSRTIFVNTAPYQATDFHLTADDKNTLFNRGLGSGNSFLAGWDWEKWQGGNYAM